MTEGHERDLRRLILELGDQAPPTPTWDELRRRASTIETALEPSRRPRRSPVLAIAAVLLVLVGTAGIFAARGRPSESPTSRNPAAPPTESKTPPTAQTAPTTEDGPARDSTLPVEAAATNSGLATGGLPLLDLDDVGAGQWVLPT